MEGIAKTPSSPRSEPAAKPAIDELTRVCGARSSTPKSIEDDGNALMAPGFQKRVPEASIGAPVEAPPIERLTGPAPVKMMPIWACTGRAAVISTRKDRANF